MTESLPHPHPSRFSFRRIFSTLLADLLYLPRWQQLLLTLALLAGAGGWILHHSPTAQQPPAAVAAPAESPATPTPWLSRAGISLLIGFLVGWLFRTFTKIAATLAILFTALLGTLSYFKILNADMTAAATQEYHTASTWLTGQASKLKDATLAHVPSATSAGVGVFLGARKKKRI